jgi:NTE family protein
MPANPVTRLSGKKPAVAVVLQGGGALGAYHIGAYEALAEYDLHPDWVCGISIGSINAALIAGNRPHERVAKLDEWWRAISWPDVAPPAEFRQWRVLHNIASNAGALAFGQPNFFTPRPVNPFLVPNAPTTMVSFYDTTPLLLTLPRFVDFDRINSGDVRLSLGATNIASGELEFFDNTVPDQTIKPEHVLASGSLPPGFPAVQIGDKFYWDGACVSNTPLNAIIDDPDQVHRVVFVIDLWDARGKLPENMSEVLWRARQIQYASRVAHQVDAAATKVNVRHAICLLKAAGRPEVAAVPDSPLLSARRLDFVHVVYHPGPDQIPNSDAEFSRASIAERRAAGYRDLQAAIKAQPWLQQEVPAHLGALVHRVEHGQVTTLPEPNLRSTSDARTTAAA